MQKQELCEKNGILEVEGLEMHFPTSEGLFSARNNSVVRAVNGVTFSIDKGKTFGLVGESGCGKTTIGKCVLRILQPTGGKIIYRGANITHFSDKQIRPFRRQMQMIFQDPYGSLNPRQSVNSIIKEAIIADGRKRRKEEVQTRSDELLFTVGLDPQLGERFPHEMSGGQRQRLGIARALACDPQLIVCDEPISALDVSIQAQIINLFEELQTRFQLTYLFIAHDLAVVRHIADDIGVMYLGKIVEITSASDLYDNPLHPYTKALLSAVPLTDYYREKRRERIILSGDVPSPVNPPVGCPFHPRCYEATGQCQENMPELKSVNGNHRVACHNVK